MEIKIRDLSESTIYKINEFAKKQNKSRNEYLKEQLEFLALEPELIQKDDSYRKIINIILKELKENQNLVKRAIEIIQKEEINGNGN